MYIITTTSKEVTKVASGKYIVNADDINSTGDVFVDLDDAALYVIAPSGEWDVLGTLVAKSRVIVTRSFGDRPEPAGLNVLGDLLLGAPLLAAGVNVGKSLLTYPRETLDGNVLVRNLTVGKDVDLIGAGISASGSVIIGGKVYVGGGLSGDSITSGGSMYVSGDVTARERLTVHSNLLSDGSVFAAGGINVDGTIDIGGELRSGIGIRAGENIYAGEAIRAKFLCAGTNPFDDSPSGEIESPVLDFPCRFQFRLDTTIIRKGGTE